MTNIIDEKETRKILYKHNINDSLLPDNVKNATMNNFDWSWNAKENAKEYKFLKNYDANSKNRLYIYGIPGTGKSHIVISIAKKIAWETEKEIMFVSQLSFNESVRNLYNDRYNGIYDKALKVDHLIFDDFGEGSMTDIAIEKTINLIKYRHYYSKSMDISTNFTGDEFINDVFGVCVKPILDRINEDFHRIILSGESYRKKLRSNKKLFSS